ncbi:Beta-1,4-endoglucanase [Meloidogyne graminicola]|uniref:Beta-1,4-endoglucanase n=1 Tax=Meloidogyne graminicola TaxID=189291 RepID=A0A8S9ZJY6_9BILA|nr:Beta-1,4-endoglucanase [Meloidogyne graminicola]
MNMSRFYVPVRAPIGTDVGGYMDNPKQALESAYNVIDASIKNGIYVLVDWHDTGSWNCNKSSDVQRFTNKAKEFFTIITKKYNGVPNVLLEFWNEPNCEWNIVKKYHIDVLNVNKDVVVILGSSDVAKNIFDHVVGKNIMYTLHWYPLVNENVYYNYPKEIIKNATALKRGLFISEYGETDVYPLAAPIKYDAIYKFWDLMDQNKLSYMKWTFANLTDNKAPNLGMSIILNNCNANQVYEESCLSDSGKLFRSQMWKYNNGLKGC